MSTIGIAPRLPLLGPPPEAPQFHFWTVALDLNDPDVRAEMRFAGEDEFRWTAGVEVLPYPTDPPFGWNHCDTGTMRDKDLLAEGRDWRTFDPFIAYVPEFCTGMGAGPWEQFQSRADKVLLASDAYSAERQLAFGQPNEENPSLDDTNLVVLGSNVGPTEGLALLEDAGAQTARAYVIHATPAIATMWASNRLLLWMGDRIVTVATRTPVIVGHGYVDVDPDAAPGPVGDTEWAFVTGPVFGARGPLTPLTEELSESLDRTNNDLNYIAEREMLVGWDGYLQAGVLIDRSATP